MGYRVEAAFLHEDGTLTTMFIIQYGGDTVSAGRKAFDKVQKLLIQEPKHPYRIVAARYTRAKRSTQD